MLESKVAMNIPTVVTVRATHLYSMNEYAWICWKGWFLTRG